MRVLAMFALALSLAGCNGDRMKDSMNFAATERSAVGDAQRIV